MKNSKTRVALALGWAVVLGPALASCSTAPTGDAAGARGQFSRSPRRFPTSGRGRSADRARGS
ncbi:hypothetical protein [Streptomyces scopuliridis]|uniref:hypothetical protein n=1 Tax=Streptomyces scopuliridis TaxID=452529 RepID=UPI0035D5452D